VEISESVYIGVDYGRRRTGFALSLSGVVIPLEPLCGSTWKGIAHRLNGMVKRHGPAKIVLGLPLSAGGKPTELSMEVESLAEFLRDRGFHVELVNEVCSTQEACTPGAGGGGKDGRSDSMAAMVILKRFLGLP